MNKPGYIYKITSPTGAVYIGQTINLKARISRYRRLQCKAQPIVYASLCKHGFDSHVVEVLYQSESVSQTELNKLEKHYIRLFDSVKTNSNKGMNLNSGGRAEFVLSNQSREKISQANKRRPPEVNQKISQALKGRKQPEEVKKKRALSLRGRVGYWTGKKMPREMVERAAAKRKGRKMSEEQRKRLSLAKKGRPLSEAHKSALRVPKKQWSTERRLAHGKHVLAIDLGGTVIAEYLSMRDASRQTGISAGNISACVNGHRATAGNFIWKLKNHAQYQ